MTRDHLASLTHELGVWLAEPGALAGSMSQSQVHAVTRSDQTRAVLKITTAADGPARDAAERELHVYLHLRDDLGVRTPELLDHRHSTSAIAILLTVHPAPQPALDWSRRQWLDLAGDLARLHETPVPAGPAWRRPSWLAATLHDPDVTSALAFWTWPGEPELLEPIIANTTALHDAIRLTTDCFVHGDCHTDNILIDHHQLIWTDWQGAGVGSPAAELAFPSVRATPAGAALPQHEMIDRYARARGLDAAQLGRATLAAELAIFLLTWPEYARYNSTAGIHRVHQRVQNLARAWLDS